MIRYIILLTTILASCLDALPRTTVASPAVAPAISMVEGMIKVDLRLDLKDIDVRSNEVVIAEPYLVNGNDSLALGTIGIYGHRRYIQYQRGLNGRIPNPDVVVKASDATSDFNFNTQVAYQEWMDGATLNMKMNKFGCANCKIGETVSVTGIDRWLLPHLNIDANDLTYVRPLVDSVKVRNLAGSAKIDFPVNSTVLLEDFRNNFKELADVRASIDSVRDNKDATIQSISICGYASPEGSYQNNERLAKGRTEAVVAYVNRIYSFPQNTIKSSSVAEDWEGLRIWVEKSNLEDKKEILAIIDDAALTPDARDQKIRSQFPTEYATLLNTVYPGLRHTDYLINYSIRSYNDPVEILSVMKSHPGNLSLEELFVAAKSLSPDSDEFRELFEVAVRLHPSDPVANLNAANTALLRGDSKAARAYLEKAGESKEADYARGILALMENNYSEAEKLLSAAQESDIPQAARMLQQLRNLMEYENLLINTTPDKK